MITPIINGVPYTDFVGIRLVVSMQSMSNDFSFTASAVNGFPAAKQGDEIAIQVDGVLRMTGYIDEVQGSEEEGTHTVTYSGRDKTADLVDSQIDKIDDLRAGPSLTLKRIIEKVLEDVGATVTVEDQYSPPAFTEAEDVVSPRVGESAFAFISGYAKKRQAILSSTPSGNILITAATPTAGTLTLQSLIGADTNNVLAQSWSINASSRFNRYVRRGQLEPKALNFSGFSSSETVENQSGAYVDPTTRAGRQKVVVESQSYSSEQLAKRAFWDNQLSRGVATNYNCVVYGHADVDVNSLARVNSAAADINRDMLIETVVYVESEGSGSTTALELVEKDVYTADQQFLSQRPVGSQNDAFKSLG